MDITYLGHSSFKIKTKTATIVTDPFFPEKVGFKFSKTEADIVTVSHLHEDHNYIEGVTGEPFVINLPGEYETKGVFIFGFSSSHDEKGGDERGKNTIYLIESEDLKVVHLGDLGASPSDAVMEEIIGADVLFVPVGGVATIGPKQAAELVSKIEPLIVVPMHYKAPEMKEAFNEFSPVEKFLSEMGAEQAERLPKLSISKSSLPEETKVVVLERKS